MPAEHEVRIAETPAEQVELTESQGLLRMIEDRLNAPRRDGNYLQRKIDARFVSWRNPKR